jgi:hypothetical protein
LASNRASPIICSGCGKDIRDPVLKRLSRQRFRQFRREIVKRLPPMRVSAGKAAQLLDAQFHGAVVQWALEPRGRLARFIAHSLKDWFRLAGVVS